MTAHIAQHTVDAKRKRKSFGQWRQHARSSKGPRQSATVLPEPVLRAQGETACVGSALITGHATSAHLTAQLQRSVTEKGQPHHTVPHAVTVLPEPVLQTVALARNVTSNARALTVFFEPVLHVISEVCWTAVGAEGGANADVYVQVVRHKYGSSARRILCSTGLHMATNSCIWPGATSVIRSRRQEHSLAPMQCNLSGRSSTVLTRRTKSVLQSSNGAESALEPNCHRLAETAAHKEPRQSP
jgi:hypothetical protein